MPGAVHTAGAIEVTESEIIEFARRYDPQPMHTDPRRGARPVRRADRERLAYRRDDDASLCRQFPVARVEPASPGLDELRWHLPVRPGDLLSLRVTILEARPSRKNPEQGVVRSLSRC